MNMVMNSLSVPSAALLSSSLHDITNTEVNATKSNIMLFSIFFISFAYIN